MKKRNFLLILGVLSFALASAASCFAGVESSGGAEFNTATPAWFMSLDPNARIRTCTLMAPDFGVDKATAEQTLREAFQKWGDYMIRKRVQILPENYLDTHDIYITALTLLPECDGSEDLRVYFGVKDEQVEKTRARFIKPFGFVQSTAKDPQAIWGKGFIYISTNSEIAPAAPWATPGHLQGILLHEIGHILGNGHVDGTIMDAELGRDLRFWNTDRAWALENIDIGRELKVCIDCGETYVGALNAGYMQNMDDALRKLVGPGAGQVSSVRFVKKSKIEDENGHHPADYNLPEGVLTFKAGSVSYEFAVKAVTRVSTAVLEVALFERTDGFSRSYGVTYWGTITNLKGGESLPVAINVNTNGFAFQVLLLDGQKDPQSLFSAYLVGN